MKLLTISAIALMAASAASAQDAFITQIGDGNSGLNVSGGSGTGTNTQVIAQQGNGLSAANLANDGEDNYAYAYQENTGQSYLYFCGFFCVDVAGPREAESLIWQSEGDDNTAVNVQISSGAFGDGVSDLSDPFGAQTIQIGSDNTAVNWQQNQSIAGLNASAVISLATPTLSLSPSATPTPSPILATQTLPFGTSAGIN